MSAVDSLSTTNNDLLFDRKRKLEDYDCTTPSETVRHRKTTAASNSKGKNVIDAAEIVGQSSGVESEVAMKEEVLQFFVKMINGGKNLVLRAKKGDKVEKVQEMIMIMTGVKVNEQRLIYRGRQLQLEMTLEECGVANDAGLELVGRIRSTNHPLAWRVISDMVIVICGVCKNEIPALESNIVKDKLDNFMALQSCKNDPFSKLSSVITKKTVKMGNLSVVDDDGVGFRDKGALVRPGGEEDGKAAFYNIFLDAFAPQALVMMYNSVNKKIKDVAEECVKEFLSSLELPGTQIERVYGVKIVLEFCGLLSGKAGDDKLDDLYVHCRSLLGSMLSKVEMMSSDRVNWVRARGDIKFITLQDVFPFLIEVGKSLVKDLASSVLLSYNSPQFLRDASDFSAFLQPILSFIEKGSFTALCDEVDSLFSLFTDLLTGITKCMAMMEKNKKDEINHGGWPQYLVILKELSSIAAALHPGSEDRFWAIMRQYKVALRSLVVQYASRADDNGWLLKHKDLLDFESRRQLAVLMFPEVREDYEEFHEMLIDRSQLLSESFEYISGAEPSSLHAGLFMEFKNEEATGPGVLREWFCLVTRAIFDPQNALFVPCPLDRRRFYPNPASKVDPLHLRYFRFSGRVIALALMHKIQVGVVLDRVFFLQLASRCVGVEDIKDADPCIYNSCKKILEMDPDFVDSDALGLTFVTELEELGSRKSVELCKDGWGRVVTSKNRKEYVHCLVQHHFVTSVSEQVTSFAQGFGDILRDGELRATFFDTLELEDLDSMLHGSGSDISVDDWKAHTEYHGYQHSDPQIVWFWEAVEQLNAEQKKTLLFFWTSVKYLPIEGFRGLASKVHIYKSLEPQDHLPSSHTCFYHICIPPYSSKAVMEDRLRVITQEHIGCSFGTW